MKKVNCWEYKGCGRQPGGNKVSELGVCVAALDTKCDTLNGGENGGRICWAIAGTFCGGTVQGSAAQKSATCMSCDFYRLVREEEGTIDFLMLKPNQVYKPTAKIGILNASAGPHKR